MSNQACSTPALRAPVLAVLKKFPAYGELFCSGRRPAARAELYSGKAQQPESCLYGGRWGGLGLSGAATMIPFDQTAGSERPAGEIDC